MCVGGKIKSLAGKLRLHIIIYASACGDLYKHMYIHKTHLKMYVPNVQPKPVAFMLQNIYRIFNNIVAHIFFFKCLLKFGFRRFLITFHSVVLIRKALRSFNI